jgi:disulfide bond formation protein DsbB
MPTTWNDMLKLWDNTPRRWLYLAGALIVAALFGSALYLQYMLHQDPCPLCMVQRVIFIIIGALFAVAAMFNAGRVASRVYSVLIALFALSGVGVASRHIWIQHLPADQVPACGPGLNYMLKHFPMSDVLQELMHGSGECAAKGWTFLTLGIPEWSLIWYILLGIFAIMIGWKQR